MPSESTAAQRLPVVIVGAGLSGLTLAHQFVKQGQSVQLITPDPRPGGVIETVSESGYVTESGPNTFPSTATELVTLCHDLGLKPIATSPSAKKRFLYLDNQLTQVENDPISFLFSGVLNPSALFKLVTEPFLSAIPAHCHDTITVAEYFRKKFSQEWLDNLVTPALSGIYAGDPEKMSLAATLPFVLEWEKNQKSMVFGAIARGLKGKPKKNGSTAPYQLLSLSGGLESLVKALANTLPPESLMCHTQVLSLVQNDTGYTIQVESKATGQQTLQASQVVFACPAYATASILRPLSEPVSDILKTIPYAPLAVVHLGFEASTFSKPVSGFGCLVPRNQDVQMLGSIWTSSLFPDRAPEGQHLFSCFIGGDLAPQDLDLRDDQLVSRTETDISRLFYQPKTTATYQRVVRYHQAIPQYRPGHLSRLAEAESLLKSILPGIHLLGNAYHGVSLNDCVKHAQALACI